MTDDDGSVSRISRAEAFLRASGAAELPHPGGTLLEHLGRVRRTLAGWGAEPAVQLAGWCHAAYGTDGFDPFLLPLSERRTLADLIGDRAEEIVYLYASCDRATVYPRIGREHPVVHRDRFTGREHAPADADTRALLEITAANELDVLAHNAELAERHGPSLHRLFTRAADLLSPAARAACAARLAP